MKNNIKLFTTKAIGTFFFSGLSPKAPGTVGSLFAVLFYLILNNYLSHEWMIVSSFIIFFIGWYCSHYLVTALNNKDPQIIVIDEVVGIFITMNMLPISYLEEEYALLFSLISFAAFRLFDITKPFPVSWADKKVKGGLGVMLDDVFAGFLAGFSIWIGIAIYNYI